MTRRSAAVAVWRIAAETREYRATDLSGEGSARYPGRWNELEQPVIYAADCPALAMLETVAHLGELVRFPLNRYLVRIEIPPVVWARAKQLRADELDASWAAVPAGASAVEAGAAWLRSAASALLRVPSAIVPEHQAVLINPRHADAKRLRAATTRRVDYALALRKGA
jgi:RES domain-containing protein